MLNAERIIEELVAVCHRVEAKGFVAASDGNISARLPDGNILITPSSLNKGSVTPDDLVEISLRGDRVAGRGTPSSESELHLFIYRHRPDVNAVVHCHPVYATAYAAARIPLSERLFPEVIVGLGKIPLAPYATPSTSEVGESIAPFVMSSDAVLLANHGAVTYGKDLWDAYFKMEKVEQIAHIEFAARVLGGAKELSSDEVSELLRKTGPYDGKSAPAALSPEIEITEEEFQTIVREVKKRLH